MKTSVLNEIYFKLSIDSTLLLLVINTFKCVIFDKILIAYKYISEMGIIVFNLEAKYKHK